MAKFKKSDIQKYYCSRSACFVLSILLKKPKLALSRDRKINEDFFVTKTHKALFIVIQNLAKMNVSTIGLGDIETYLATHDQLTYNRFFQIGDESEWILSLLDLNTDENNYDYYYFLLQKFAFLRAKMEMGQDVSDVLDMSEIDSKLLDEQYSIFIEASLEEIVRHYDSLNLEIKHRFTRRDEDSSRKAGVGGKELFKALKQDPDFGYRLTYGKTVDYLVRGARKGMLAIDSRESGSGKTRDALMQCCMLSCHTMWNHKTQQFEPNPYGKTVPSLYFGTELKLYKEIEPILWSVVSGVNSGSIKANNLTAEEEIRVERAIEILEESPIYLEREPNYDCRFIEDMVEKYVNDFGVEAIMIDYVELTPAMIGEYTRMTRGLQAREDSVLLNISTVLKNLTEEFDIFIKIYTQVNDSARRDGVRDSGAIKGSRSLQVRTDLAMVCMRPTEKELKLIEGLVNLHGKPTLCYHFYKNRDGEIAEFKVWVRFNLGTFEMEELFVTDWQSQEIKPKKANLRAREDEDEIMKELMSPNVEILGELPFDEETGEIVEERESRRSKGRRGR